MDQPADLSETMAEKAETVAGFLKGLANPQRLMILCCLVAGERNVGTLITATGIPQTSMSQHLAKLKEEGIVAVRRDHRSLYYRIDHPAVHELMQTLYRAFCQDRISLTPTTVSPADAARMLSSGQAILIDVRSPDEFRTEHIAAAVSLPLETLPMALEALAPPPGRALIFQCLKGSRGAAACAAVGRPDSYNLAGGIEAWKAAGLPVVA